MNAKKERTNAKKERTNAKKELTNAKKERTNAKKERTGNLEKGRLLPKDPFLRFDISVRSIVEMTFFLE